MYKTIVVPVDGSVTAARAVPIAGWLADRFGAEIHLVTATFATEVSDAEEVLRRAASHAGRTPVRQEVMRHSFPGHAIVEAVRSDGDALLCLSTRGSSGVHALLLGSVSDEVVRHAPGPLVLAGPDCGVPPADGGRIVVCVDGSDVSERVLPIVATWARELEMEAEVLLVADAHRWASFRTSTQAVVDGAVETMREAGVRCTARIELSTTPSAAIVAVASETEASLIALATHGGDGLFHEALGHVATAVVRHAPIPVLVVPVRDDET